MYTILRSLEKRGGRITAVTKIRQHLCWLSAAGGKLLTVLAASQVMQVLLCVTGTSYTAECSPNEVQNPSLRIQRCWKPASCSQIAFAGSQ